MSPRLQPVPDPRRPGAFGAAHTDPADAYAGVPILQEPRWHHELAAYFWFGGISSGAGLIGALAELSGERWRPLARTAQTVSFAAMVPCAPLLIVELGRPGRFHHMLRIFKPSSPMNLGAWTLLTHSVFATLLTARQLAERDRLPVAGPLVRNLPAKPLAAASALPAMVLGGYTGVLLGTTSVPVWSTSSMLGGLFMASSVATGTSAVSLAAIATGRALPAEGAALGAISVVAGASELCLVGGYLASSGEAARPLLRGVDGAMLLGAAAATTTSLALELAGSCAGTKRHIFSALAAGVTLAGGAMLRWAVVRAGHASATDRDANLKAMSPSAQNPGWGPPNAEGRMS